MTFDYKEGGGAEGRSTWLSSRLLYAATAPKICRRRGDESALQSFIV